MSAIRVFLKYMTIVKYVHVMGYGKCCFHICYVQIMYVTVTNQVGCMIARHFYFNRLPRLWNSLPIIDLSLSVHTIRNSG